MFADADVLLSTRLNDITDRLVGHVVDGEDVEARHAVHHAAVGVAALVLQLHGLQEVVVRLEGEHVELRGGAARVLVDDEVAALRVDALLVGVVLLLVDLQHKKGDSLHICISILLLVCFVKITSFIMSST